MEQAKQTKMTEIQAKQPLMTPQIEERIRIIANIIIDRIIEDQKNGKLRVLSNKK